MLPCRGGADDDVVMASVADGDYGGGREQGVGHLDALCAAPPVTVTMDAFLVDPTRLLASLDGGGSRRS